MFYAATVAAAGLVQAALWLRIWLAAELRRPEAPRRAVMQGLLRSLATATIFLATIPLAESHANAALFARLAVIPAVLAVRLVPQPAD